MNSEDNINFSIIIPVYNAELYLDDCIESVIKQDYINKELIIINDGSTDNSAVIIEKYKKKNSNIRVVETLNLGPSIARNTGLKLALGDYILFLDSDDYISTNMLSKCNDVFKKYNTDIVLFSAKTLNSSEICDKYPPLYYSRHPQLIYTPLQTRGLFEKMIELNNFMPSPCLYVFKKNSLKYLQFYPNIFFEDNLFTINLLIQSVVATAVCIPDQLYMRRIRNGSITCQKPTLHHLNSYLIIIDELLKAKSDNFDLSTQKALSIVIQKVIVGCLEVNLNLYKYEKSSSLKYKIISFLKNQITKKGIAQSTILFLCFPLFINFAKKIRIYVRIK